MLARTYSATTLGLNPVLIEIEVSSHRGIPKLVLIGLASKAIDESKERITSALLHAKIQLPAKRIVVNLAPADLRKTGSQFELAIAIGILQVLEETSIDTSKTIFFGELSLDGCVKPVRGILPLVLAAQNMGFEQVVIPANNQTEVANIDTIPILPIDHLANIITHPKKLALPVLQPQPVTRSKVNSFPNFSSIVGQFQAKRALEIAAAGGHNLLMVGPPGAGKTLLSQALAGILPPLSAQEQLVCSQLHSLAGLASEGLLTNRPFRAPHHTVSPVGLLGGGTALRPGEISLAHYGVLFLDEFPEFSRQAIEGLRQPVESNKVSIVRAVGTVTYPSDFILVVAANPCPCGYFGTTKPCTCSHLHRQRYWQKLSGPILDRIDLHLKVAAVPPQLLRQSSQSENSTSIQQRVIRARLVQSTRWKKLQLPITTNHQLTTQHVKEHLQVAQPAYKLLQQAMETWQLSARSYFRLLKVSRTVADLANHHHITEQDVAEVLQYRQLNFS